MRRVAENILELVGNTPMVKLRRALPPQAKERGLEIWAKLEYLNPSGSIKDRPTLAMVEDAERKGLLKPGSTIVEATSGNTGPALAMIAAAKGYGLVVVMPENAPLERRRLLMRYGVKVHLTPSGQGMQGAMRALKVIRAGIENSVTLDIFSNPAAVQVHRETTAREVLEDTGGRVDVLVVGVGSGATLTGVGEVLKEHNPKTRVVAVEPAASPMLSKGIPGLHGIPGIGPDFIPTNLNRRIIDEIVSVGDEEANEMALRLAREEGLLVGISSGANLAACFRIAPSLPEGTRIVTFFADIGERYLSFPF